MSENLFCPVVRLLLLVLSALAGGASHAQSASDEGTSPLVLAILGHDREAVERVLVEDKDALERRFVDRTPLMWAAVDGDTAIVAKLLGRKASVTATDARGYTSLMLAIEAGKKNHAILLLGAGSSLDHVAIDGHHPASLASRRGWVGFGSGLRKDYGKLSASEADGILLRAAETGDTRLLRFAIQQGARGTRAKAANGWTPLMLAALGGHEKAFDVLATKRHSLSVRDRRITVVDGISVVDALLAGDAKRNPSKLATMARVLKTRSGDKKSFNSLGRRLAARKVSSAQWLVAIFAPEETANNYRDIAGLIPVPKVRPSSNSSYVSKAALPAALLHLSQAAPGWRGLQTTLRDKGFYNGRLDGSPGHQTLDALMSMMVASIISTINNTWRTKSGQLRNPNSGSYFLKTFDEKTDLLRLFRFPGSAGYPNECNDHFSVSIGARDINISLGLRDWRVFAAGDWLQQRGGTKGRRDAKFLITLYECRISGRIQERKISQTRLVKSFDWKKISSLARIN